MLRRSGEVNMGLDKFFYMTGIVTEAAVVGLLIYRRAWRTLPVFFLYCACALVTDSLAYAITIFSPKGFSIRFYLVATVVDFVLQFSVLVELAWSVLRPLRTRLSHKALFVLAAVILAVGAAIWPIANLSGVAYPSNTWHLVIQLQQTVSILRILFFLLFAGCSQLLSLGWRDRELQVATGFGFYSLVSLAVATVNTHHATVQQFSQLSRVVVVSFLCSLIYWVFSFAHVEAERREFTPQMQSMLLTLAGNARITRDAFADSENASSWNLDQP
jgi:hypothetical protein